MSEGLAKGLAPMKLGVLFALLALVYGFGLGAAFGGKEDALKEHLREEAAGVMAQAYGGDEAEAKKVTDTAWVYLKRAHLHANGLGTATVVLILLLSLLRGGDRLRGLVALALGLGSLGYSSYWMFAGLRAPSMGSTGAAKESLSWLALPSSGLCILGLLATLALFCATAFGRRPG